MTRSFDNMNDHYGYSPATARPLAVAPLEDGSFAAVWMNRVSQREQVRAGVLEYRADGNDADFETEIVGPCIEERIATALLNWSSDARYANIYVAGPPAKKLFATVRGTGEIATGRWASHGLVLHLEDRETGVLLATAKASPGPKTCPLSPILLDPAVIEVCDPHELASTEVLWDATGLTAGGVEIRVNGIDGKLFARGGRIGSAQTGEWLRNETLFYLLRSDTLELLGTAYPEFRQVGCY